MVLYQFQIEDSLWSVLTVCSPTAIMFQDSVIPFAPLVLASSFYSETPTVAF